MCMGALIKEGYDASPAQVATAWAIAKGTLPVIGVTPGTYGASRLG